MAEESEITVQDYWRVIHERKWIILIAFVAVVASTTYFTVTSPEVYQATATLMIDPGGGGSSVLELGYRPMGSNLIQNYCQIIESRSLAEQTANRLREASLDRWGPSNEHVVDELMDRISAEPLRGTDIVMVSAKAPTATEAALIANAAVDVFIDQQIAIVRGEFTEQRQFLEEQIPIIKERLSESEEQLKEFKETNKFVALSEEARGITQKLAEFDRLYSEVQTDINTTLSRLNYLRTLLAEQRKTLPEDIAEVSSPYILELRKQLVNLETNYSMYVLQGLSEDNPKMIDLERSINDTKEKLIEETKKICGMEGTSLDPLSHARELSDKILALQAEIVALEARRDALSSVRQSYAKKLESLPATELTLARLERERELNANTYQMLMQKHEEVKIAEAGKISNVNVVDRARVPRSPIQPRKRRNLVFGMIVGLAIGLGAAFVLDYMDTSVKSPKDIDRSGNLTILGTVPLIKTKVRRKDRISGIVSHLLTNQPARSSLSEAYRTIRTNLQFASPDKPVQTLLISSAIPGEGKSTVSANLAIAMAQMGVKTLLVDADFRNPVLGKVFGVVQDKGLTDFLVGRIGFDEAISKTDIENLILLPAGALPPNPSELLGSKKMESLIEELRKQYQFIIFDSPPAIGVTDAAVLGSRLDGAVLVVRVGKTHRSALLRAKEIVERVRTNVLGVILHMVTPVHGRYGYYYGYYDYYPYYSQEKEKEAETVSC